MWTRILIKLIIVADLCALALYAGAWSNTDNIKERDFLSFYTASRLSYSELYDLDSQREAQREVLGRPFPVNSGVLPFANPSFIAPLLKLVCTTDYKASYARWRGLLLLLTLANAYLAFAILRREGLSVNHSAVAAFTVILLPPIFLSLMSGQLSAIVTLGALACLYCLLTGWDNLAGVALSLSLVKPHVALVLACALIFLRPRAFVSFALSTFALAAFSILLVGFDGAGDLYHLSRLLSSSPDYGASQSQMTNLLGALLRSGLDVGIARPGAWLAYLCALVAACLIGRLFKEPLKVLGLAALLAAFLSPHLHLHDLYLLLLPALVFAHWLYSRSAAIEAAMPGVR